MDTMRISESPAGSVFRVVRVVLGGEVGKRLADMGFTEGAMGEVVRRGFLRGPLQVRIRGYDLILRRSEAARIEVELMGGRVMGKEHRSGRRRTHGRAFGIVGMNGGTDGR